MEADGHQQVHVYTSAAVIGPIPLAAVAVVFAAGGDRGPHCALIY